VADDPYLATLSVPTRGARQARRRRGRVRGRLGDGRPRQRRRADDPTAPPAGPDALIGTWQHLDPRTNYQVTFARGADGKIVGTTSKDSTGGTKTCLGVTYDPTLSRLAWDMEYESANGATTRYGGWVERHCGIGASGSIIVTGNSFTIYWVGNDVLPYFQDTGTFARVVQEDQAGDPLLGTWEPIGVTGNPLDGNQAIEKLDPDGLQITFAQEPDGTIAGTVTRAPIKLDLPCHTVGTKVWTNIRDVYRYGTSDGRGYPDVRYLDAPVNGQCTGRMAIVSTQLKILEAGDFVLTHSLSPSASYAGFRFGKVAGPAPVAPSDPIDPPVGSGPKSGR
jgi:hypothetical protein